MQVAVSVICERSSGGERASTSISTASASQDGCWLGECLMATTLIPALVSVCTRPIRKMGELTRISVRIIPPRQSWSYRYVYVRPCDQPARVRPLSLDRMLVPPLARSARDIEEDSLINPCRP